MIILKEKEIDLEKILRVLIRKLDYVDTLLIGSKEIRKESTLQLQKEEYQEYQAELEKLYARVKAAHQDIADYFLQSKRDYRIEQGYEQWFIKYGNRLIGVLEEIMDYDKRGLQAKRSYFEVVQHLVWEVNHLKTTVQGHIPHLQFGSDFEKSLKQLNQFFGVTKGGVR